MFKGGVLKEITSGEARYWFAAGFLARPDGLAASPDTGSGMSAVAMPAGAATLQNPGLVLRMSFR